MSVQQIIVYLIGFVCLIWIVKKIYRMLFFTNRSKKSCKSCPLGCCSSSSNNKNSSKRKKFE